MAKLENFPEKVEARITLMSCYVSCSYNELLQSCLTRYYAYNFDSNGNFIWKEQDQIEESFKKFYKKVPQDFKTLIKKSKKNHKNIESFQILDIKDKVKNDYNQTLLDIIHAGIDENFPLLHQLCRTYYDSLTQKLYKYYVNQNIKKYPLGTMNKVKNLTEIYSKQMQQLLCIDGIGSDIVQDKIYQMLFYEDILEISLMPNALFVLVHKFLSFDIGIQVCKELFLANGILKKYKNHFIVNHHDIHSMTFDNELIRIINFILMICTAQCSVGIQSKCYEIIRNCCMYHDKKIEHVRSNIVAMYESLLLDI